MTVSYIYIILFLMYLFGNKTIEGANEFFTVTNVLLAFGIISICSRLDDLKRKWGEGMLGIILAILILALYVIFVGYTIYSWKETFFSGWGFDFSMLIISIVLTLLCLLPVGIMHDEYKKSEAVTEINVVEVEIIDKNHSPASTVLIYTGSMFVPIIKTEKYNVTLSDGELEKTIDNEDLYNKLEIGDSFEVNKIIYKDSSGEIFEQDFEFIGGD